MKLIDKASVLAEINKLKGKVDDGSSYCNGWHHALRMLEIELDTLGVKEIGVDVGSHEGDWSSKTVKFIDADGNTFNKAQKGE
jgi:hypothetical protein